MFANGWVKRIMFGTDQMERLDAIGMAIEVIEEQRRDISTTTPHASCACRRATAASVPGSLARHWTARRSVGRDLAVAPSTLRDADEPQKRPSTLRAAHRS